jgi:hypothetical protein
MGNTHITYLILTTVLITTGRGRGGSRKLEVTELLQGKVTYKFRQTHATPETTINVYVLFSVYCQKEGTYLRCCIKIINSTF